MTKSKINYEIYVYFNFSFSSQLKAARLHSYWKKICMDEKRAQQRNIMLVREFERIDAHLSSLEARKERLNFLKVRDIKINKT